MLYANKRRKRIISEYITIILSDGACVEYLLLCTSYNFCCSQRMDYLCEFLKNGNIYQINLISFHLFFFYFDSKGGWKTLFTGQNYNYSNWKWTHKTINNKITGYLLICKINLQNNKSIGRIKEGTFFIV